MYKLKQVLINFIIGIIKLFKKIKIIMQILTIKKNFSQQDLILISQKNDKSQSRNKEAVFNSFKEIISTAETLDFSSQTLFFVLKIKKFQIADAIDLATLIQQYKNLHTLALDFRNTTCLLESILVIGEQLKYSCVNTIILDIRQLDIMNEKTYKQDVNQTNKPTNIVNMKLNIRKDNQQVGIKELQKCFTFMNRQNKVQNKQLFEVIAETLSKLQSLKQIGLYFNQSQVSEDNSSFVCEHLLKCKNLSTLTMNIYNPFMFNEDFVRLGDILSSTNIITQLSLFLYIINIDQQSANHLGNSFQNCKTLESLQVIVMANQITQNQAFYLAKNLQSCEKLSSLHLSFQFLNLNCQESKRIAKLLAFCKKLTSLNLDLRGNNIEQKGCLKIGKYLSLFPTLKILQLNISLNRIQNQDILLMVKNLSKSQTLTYIVIVTQDEEYQENHNFRRKVLSQLFKTKRLVAFYI
ncbi:kinase domain protein, putative (macronuclear) [Tetrahymena thermophila SB210]|uniref:Kinase domain protein, putative n=1 Tax=Tetrahymena thermophila (strain SB210) TaxID=312017 RepID=W7XIC3_TETTS|nr:kinase domain protein, putative [Tetrahymena thermophila SB210]EWS74511.1 kinase domain protein, putative [Tetrahymena thermophila SB210]|eukprot:XP_012652941.1 kinase domain protein, putative [Tetrahymena thermophila SB210]